MKVDMSPKAITLRLKLVDQLWETSLKLMKAGKKPKRILDLPKDLERRSVIRNT